MTDRDSEIEKYESLMALEPRETGEMSLESDIANFTRIVSLFCKVPIALMTLVGEDKVLVRSSIGMNECEIDRNESFCSHTVQGEGILEVKDTLEDERFSQLAAVRGDERIRYYAGAPLVTPDGRKIGALCILDHVPRQLTTRESDFIQTMSRQLMNLISLKESEQRLSDLFENVSDLIQSISPEGEIVWVNAKWRETLGYNQSELSSINIFDIIAPNCQQHFREVFQKLLKDDNVGIFNVSFIAKDGKFVRTEGRVNVRFEGRKPILMRGIFRDVTQEHANKKQSELFKQTLDRTFDAILMYEPENFRFIYANKSALKKTGHTMAELKMMRPWEIDAKIQPEQAQQMFHQLREGTQKSVVFETELCHKSGHTTEVEITLQYLSDDFSPRFIAIVRDITEQRKALLELKKAKNQAEEANQAKNRFLSRVSHELRTPLNSIIGFSKLLLMGNISGKEYENTERIHNSGTHLLELITDIMDISSMESDELKLNLETVDIHVILYSVRDLMKPQAEEAKAEISCLESEDKSLTLITDRRRLKQILINLVSNAIKYGGKDCLIKLYAQRFEDRLLIRVKDNGLGISNEKTQRLFTPFDRLDAERNMSETKGTGLGLAIVKKLAKTLGGDIAVISKLNEGSVFTVDLPTLPEVP